MPLFRNCSASLIRRLVVRLQLQVCLRGDVALMYNEEGKRMYFVHRGTMQVMHENFTLSYLKSGAYFGEIGLITSKQTATARARRGAECAHSDAPFLGCCDTRANRRLI